MTLKIDVARIVDRLQPGEKFSVDRHVRPATHIKIKEIRTEALGAYNCVYMPTGDLMYLRPATVAFPELQLVDINTLKPGEPFMWDGEAFLRTATSCHTKAVRLSDGIPCTPTGNMVGRLPDDWRVNS
jgi:hypothetical protein